jgi:hypothetical protein
MIRQKINRVQKVKADLVPVTLHDTFNVFVPSGVMTAIAPTSDSSTLWQWEQLEGTPVSYTSTLNTDTITWNSTDLERKRFQVWTNRGTINEQTTTAYFLHYPLDTVTTSKSTTVSANIINNTHFNESMVKPRIENGIIPLKDFSTFSTSNALDLKNNASLGETVGTVNSAYVSGDTDLPVRIVRQVTHTVLQKLVSSSYSTINTDTGYVRTYEGLSVGAYRVIYKCFHKGFLYELVVYFNEFRNIVANKVNNKASTSISCSISNYNGSVSTVASIVPIEVISEHTTSVSSNISNLTYSISTITYLSEQELNAVKNINTAVSANLINYSFQLQTSTGVI